MSAHHSPHRWLVAVVCLAVVPAPAVVGAHPAHAIEANGTLVFERIDFQGLGDRGLKTVNPDGTGLRTLAGEPVTFYDDPVWSPDGSKIAVARVSMAETGGTDIWIMDADGGNRTQLTDTVGNDSDQQWSPHGSTIAFSRSDVIDDQLDIWTVAAAGGAEAALTATTDRSEWLVDWSPDGSRILFESYPVAGGTGRVEVMNADGTGRATILEAAVRDLAWSPHGSRIVYCREMGMVSNRTADGPDEVPTYDIWAMDAVGANQENLTGTPIASECGPQWTNSGRILYVAEGGIWVMDSDGNKKTNLSAVGGIGGGGPALSPDGSMIAFTRAEITESDWGTTSLWVMNADGTSPRQLTSGDYWDLNIAWQPIPIAGAGMVDVTAGIWHLDGASFYYGNPGDYPMLGDWDCDGIETPGLYRRSDGYVYLRNSTTQGVADVKFFFGNPGDIPLAGDFDGDGCDTVSLYRPSEGKVYVIDDLGNADTGLGAADFSYYFGNPSDKPFVGDFDEDGVDTIGLHRESTGLVYIRNSHTTGIAEIAFVYGDPGDRLVCHSWTGTGADTVAVFRPVDGRLYFRFTNTQGIADATLRWGESDSIPVAGDL